MARAPRRLVADETGATAIEYALLVALIAGVLVGTLASLGLTVSGLFDRPELELLERTEDSE
jgi:pilus assembly protein Flp/PilA